MSLSKGTIFSQIDITVGYHNIRIKSEDQHKSVFVLPWGNMNLREYHLVLKRHQDIFNMS
ncbi:hypothetical protein A0H76_1309 [Hepatospora eriocheir]|uniref:Uncharacterized protein n=1 Tax=Hepatospora eriocheir TaxID=1081669 RepID=A0A1X0QKW9_9MICR|nr:hypothetical protein A0H76_1309 [Hepatospora eriocheir]